MFFFKPAKSALVVQINYRQLAANYLQFTANAVENMPSVIGSWARMEIKSGASRMPAHPVYREQLQHNR
jgi:hypothetical protein